MGGGGRGWFESADARDIQLRGNLPQNLALCVLHGQPLTRVSTTREMIAQSTWSDMGSHMRAHRRFTIAVVQHQGRKSQKPRRTPLMRLLLCCPRIPWISPPIYRDFAISHGLLVTLTSPQRCWPLFAIDTSAPRVSLGISLAIRFYAGNRIEYARGNAITESVIFAYRWH